MTNDDQPKSKIRRGEPTPGEWTETFVHNMAVRGDFVGLRDAHNAALAAEKKRAADDYIALCDKANGDMVELNKQLAAEREKVQRLQSLITELESEFGLTNEERQKADV